ncbi:glycosyltransferase [Phycicoccus sp.]|uniref:glycosyltransferase n=1 Tax=Phycicoccus sp. TaxID=1902410 RepID=UPI002C7A2497|nr:glycosyltransferase [Phycicoccus sp.]HMM96377.1 glycosyltransferase [Phycicoccus sp.]
MGAEHVVLAAYVACLVLVLVFSLTTAHLAVAVLRARRHPVAPGSGTDPRRARVTVQLPIYNELHVAERVIDAAARLHHPPQLLRIQVLDDSTDATTAVVDAAVARHRVRGVDVRVVRRADRAGYKAGALADGLARDDAEFVLVLDADFVPRPDLVERLLAGVDGPDVAAVQARWGFLNEEESMTTRVEAFLLGMHFGVEQPGRALTGGMLNFNGTAGMWRRAAIEDAGGWDGRTVTEDIDLSYRAQLRGWRIVYLEDVVVPSELPADIGALRGQQHRWIKGGAQNARLHLGAVARHDAPGQVRWHAAAHLLSGTLYTVILAMLTLSVPLAALKNTAVRTEYVDWGMPFTAATLALGWTLAVAHRPRGRRGWLRFGLLLPAFLVFTMGLAVHNGLAALSGWFGRPGGEFVRTAKAGTDGWRTAAYAGRTVDRRVLRELAAAGWLVLGLAVAWWRREPALVPLQLMGLTGLSWVLALSVLHPWQARRRVRGARGVPSPRPQEVTS